MKSTALALLGLTFLCADALLAQEWARYRGPNGDGIGTTKLAATFEEERFDWSIDVPGEGYSSPVLWGDRLFLTTADKAGTTRSVLCYSSTDGALLWESKHPFSQHKINGKFNGHASTTPVVDAERVYLVWGNGTDVEVTALDHDGELVWQKKWGGFDDTDHGMFAAPVLVDAVLLVPQDHVGSGARLVGIDAATGETLWEVPRKNAKDSYSSPVIHQTKAGDKQAIFVSTSGGFTAIDPTTGKFVWEYNPGYGQRSVGSPVLANGLVFATLGSGGGAKESAALRPGTLDRPAELVYEINKALPYVPTPLVIGRLMFFLNDAGMISCIDHKTGEVIYDRERLSEGPSVKWFASPVSDGGKIFCASQSGEMVVVAAKKEFEVLGRHDFGELINACPAIANGRLYVRTASKLHAIRGE